MDQDIKSNIEAIQNGATKRGNINFKDVRVFTMPKNAKGRAVQKNSEADSAKKTGFIILIFGSLFLILLLAASYYFFVMKPGQENVADLNQDVNQGQADNEKVETKEIVPEKKEETKKVNNEIKKISQEQEVQSPKVDNKDQEDIENINNQQKRIDSEIVAEEDVLEESVPVEKPLIVIVDNDNDGLSVEEEMVVGTSDSSPDTDSDSYTDLAEMMSGYNPLGEGFLSDNVNFKKFVNSQNSFYFYYPQAFEVSANTNDAIILDLGDEEFFQLFIEVNKNKLNIEDWYKNQFGVNTIDNQLIFINGDWNVVKNADSKSIFFKNNRDDYVIAFNYSSKDEGEYQNIFEIVFNTFKMID